MPFMLTHDKYLHFYAGLPMGFALLVAFKIVFPSVAVFEALWALFVSALVSFGFEFFSLFTGWGVYDVWDGVATLVGAALGIGAAVAAFT